MQALVEGPKPPIPIRRSDPTPQATRPSRKPDRIAWIVHIATTRPELRQGVMSLVDQAVVSGTSFITSLIIGRLCSREELGVFYLALTIVYLTRGIQEQLVSAPYTIYCHKRPSKSLAFYSGSALVHHLGISGVALLVIVAVLALGIGPPGLTTVAYVLLGVLPLAMLREFLRRLMIAHLEMVSAIAIDVCVAVLQIGSLVALAYFGRLTVPMAYGVMGAACAVACGGWFLFKHKTLRPHWGRAVRDWRHNWGFARWALATHLIGSATPYFMPWIVLAMRGKAEAGGLAACVTLVGLAGMFLTGVATYLTPRAAQAFARGGTAELRRVLRQTAWVFALFLGAFAFLVLASGDFLLVLAYGGKYAGYGLAMGILSVSMLALSMGLTAGNGLWAIDRPSANIKADVCTLVVTLGVAVCLVGPWGVVGAALADLSGNTIGAIIRYRTLSRLLRTLDPSATV